MISICIVGSIQGSYITDQTKKSSGEPWSVCHYSFLFESQNSNLQLSVEASMNKSPLRLHVLTYEF
jgi:hypothetical protein